MFLYFTKTILEILYLSFHSNFLSFLALRLSHFPNSLDWRYTRYNILIKLSKNMTYYFCRFSLFSRLPLFLLSWIFFFSPSLLLYCTVLFFFRIYDPSLNVGLGWLELAHRGFLGMCACLLDLTSPDWRSAWELYP